MGFCSVDSIALSILLCKFGTAQAISFRQYDFRLKLCISNCFLLTLVATFPVKYRTAKCRRRQRRRLISTIHILCVYLYLLFALDSMESYFNFSSGFIGERGSTIWGGYSSKSILDQVLVSLYWVQEAIESPIQTSESCLWTRPQGIAWKVFITSLSF